MFILKGLMYIIEKLGTKKQREDIYTVFPSVVYLVITG